MNKPIITIMRHGNASHRAESDALRPLTDIGRHESLASFKHWEAKLANVKQLVSSPYLRARQTADTVLNAAKKAGIDLTETEIWDSITPDGDVEAVADQILAAYQHRQQNIMLVSHMPFVAELTHYLLHGEQGSGHGFSTGQIVIVYFDELPLPGCCTIK
jgi:phosphohistidine phosphatase